MRFACCLLVFLVLPAPATEAGPLARWIRHRRARPAIAAPARSCSSCSGGSCPVGRPADHSIERRSSEPLPPQ